MIYNVINTSDLKSMKCHFLNNIKKKAPELNTYELIILLII